MLNRFHSFIYHSIRLYPRYNSKLSNYLYDRPKTLVLEVVLLAHVPLLCERLRARVRRDLLPEMQCRLHNGGGILLQGMLSLSSLPLLYISMLY